MEKDQFYSSQSPRSGEMSPSVKYCFCTLAFGDPYRLAAKHLAQQLQKCDIDLFVVTDEPQYFKDLPKVNAVKLHRTSILYAYNDKRFALENALKHYECAVLVDADSEIIGDIPQVLEIPPGMYANTSCKSLEENLKKHHPKNYGSFQLLAQKLKIDLSQTQWICENLIIIRRSSDQEWKFLDTWELADRWLGIRQVFQGDHSYIGVAAAVAGWQVDNHPEFSRIKEIIKNQGRRHIGFTGKVWQPKSKIFRKMGFYWRWLQAFLRTFLEPKKYVSSQKARGHSLRKLRPN
ncbi:hypothetical protein, partial [Crocosphaera sp. Alani8]|uniref:hypothetical protein n=1 Tax=Crocosphaera sp. Alani8 TaxID=3038952 RepID=UPI00313A7DCF